MMPAPGKLFPTGSGKLTDPSRFLASEATAGGTVALADARAYAERLRLGGTVLDARAVEAAFAAATPARAGR